MIVERNVPDVAKFVSHGYFPIKPLGNQNNCFVRIISLAGIGTRNTALLYVAIDKIKYLHT